MTIVHCPSLSRWYEKYRTMCAWPTVHNLAACTRNNVSLVRSVVRHCSSCRLGVQASDRRLRDPLAGASAAVVPEQQAAPLGTSGGQPTKKSRNTLQRCLWSIVGCVAVLRCVPAPGQRQAQQWLPKPVTHCQARRETSGGPAHEAGDNRGGCHTTQFGPPFSAKWHTPQ